MADNVFTRLKDKFQETDLYKSIYEATDGGDNYFNDNKRPNAVLSEADQNFVDELPKELQLDINRYLSIFKNDPSAVYNYIADIKEKGSSNLLEDRDYVEEFATDKFDKMRYNDYKFLGKSTYDLQFDKGSEGAKEFKKAIMDTTAVDTVAGIGHGFYQTARGTSELLASLSDLYLDTDYLKTVEEVLPQVDLSELLERPEPAYAQFVSLLTQYGTPIGLAQKIVKKK